MGTIVLVSKCLTGGPEGRIETRKEKDSLCQMVLCIVGSPVSNPTKPFRLLSVSFQTFPVFFEHPFQLFFKLSLQPA